MRSNAVRQAGSQASTAKHLVSRPLHLVSRPLFDYRFPGMGNTITTLQESQTEEMNFKFHHNHASNNSSYLPSPRPSCSRLSLGNNDDGSHEMSEKWRTQIHHVVLPIIPRTIIDWNGLYCIWRPPNSPTASGPYGVHTALHWLSYRHTVCSRCAQQTTSQHNVRICSTMKENLDLKPSWVCIICKNQSSELCESRGGRPGLPVPISAYGLCGCKATLNLNVL